MKLPSVRVSMDPAFKEALEAFAAEYETTAATVLLRGAKAILSKSHKWNCKTRGRPLAGGMRVRAKVGTE